MSLRFEDETNVYDDCGNLLGQICNGDPGFFPSFLATKDAEMTVDELRELTDYLEAQ